MEAEGGIITFIFTGENGEVIPQNATRFIAHESVTAIPARAFERHPNIVELICHAGVTRIGKSAFYKCPRLRRVIIPGVKVVEDDAFCGCVAVMDFECPMLEMIGESAFEDCESLSNINLPSAKVVEEHAFDCCVEMKEAKFGRELESIRGWAFWDCSSLERITIPLKNGLINGKRVFGACVNLKSVDLVEGAVLRETIAALLLEEWRKKMEDEIESINQILPNTSADNKAVVIREGTITRVVLRPEVGKTVKFMVIREWITSVLCKIIHYKAKHRRLLADASISLNHALPKDVVMNSVLPFLELPSHTFEGEN